MSPAARNVQRIRATCHPSSDTGQDSEAYDASGAAGLAAMRRLVGDSEALRSVKRRVAKVARSMAPVLVRGESGTGKELVAQAHSCLQSPRGRAHSSR